MEKENDLLVGAKAIAEYLGEGWTRNKVYRLAENDETTFPIWNEPGIGVVSAKSAITAWKTNHIARAVEGRRARD